MVFGKLIELWYLGSINFTGLSTDKYDIEISSKGSYTQFLSMAYT